MNMSEAKDNNYVSIHRSHENRKEITYININMAREIEISQVNKKIILKLYYDKDFTHLIIDAWLIERILRKINNDDMLRDYERMKKALSEQVADKSEKI